MEASLTSTGREWSVSLIQTKMIAPRPPSGYVQRPALLNQFEALRPASVVLVTAPAGFGKTTLLAGWSKLLAEKKHPVAWLSLDEEDDDPQQFGAYLVAALSRAAQDIARQAQQLLSHDALTPIRMVISVLLNGIAECGRSVFLVLDEVDRLSATPVLAALSRLLRYAPENLYILLGARAEPALMLGQLRSPEKLRRIGADDLRFSLDDAQSFFDCTGTVPLDRNSVALLNDAAEGWVAGLQLASLTLVQADDAEKLAKHLASPRSGIDLYLNDTVLAHLPPPILTFLLNTSILERLNPGVCDAIMAGEESDGEESGNSGEKLHWLEMHNVFIQPLDESQGWYRYHALLSEGLRRRLLRQMPLQVPVLHRRACQWFAAEGLWPEAVRHALAAGDSELATQWVENCAIDMLERGDPYTMLGWINRLPPDAVRGRLRLRLAKAWGLAFSLQTAQASSEINAVVDDLERAGNEQGSVIDEAVLAEVNAVGAFIAGTSDDSERALELGRAAEASSAALPPWARRYAQSTQFFGLMYRGGFEQILRTLTAAKDRAEQGVRAHYSDILRDAMYALAALAHGELSGARRTFEATLQRAEIMVGRSSAGVAGLASCLASIYYECNELPNARQMLAGRSAIVLATAPLGTLMRHVLAAARVLWRDGETGSALAVLEDCRQIAVERDWLRLKLACDAETVRLLIDGGDVAQAKQIADELSESVPARCEGRPGSAIEAWTYYCVLRARVLLAGNQAGEAIGFLEGSLDTLNAMSWRPSEASVALLLARAFEQCGDADKAVAALGRALRIGAAIGLVNSFVDEGQPIRELLLRFRQIAGNTGTAEAAYADRLLTVFAERDGARPEPARSAGVAAMSSDILSAREMEIINCVALGLSNKEIARSLKLAPETIKWHLKNIFEKLNVSSRIEAVQSVLGLGLRESRVAM
ncbi:LuxR C-terminal-related transcriptional regulator [Paraburkholderia sp. ZP32-5]|uniref:LuxR C-terminal-related transcriptional regulator n=1 Tax=Paraburkholderia sp. ZP32-5 TaxID=2883245 RepID=UPI001F2681A3|nr:LuxR C-terminal-related transcriptional regulator [Paraburkholderia sp. ZP32-5]